MNDCSDNINLSLDALKDAYAAKIPATVGEIEKTFDDSVQAARVLAHNLAGAAGLYGFERLGDAAGDLEQACEALLIKGVKPSEHDLKRVEESIAVLRKMVVDDSNEQKR